MSKLLTPEDTLLFIEVFMQKYGTQRNACEMLNRLGYRGPKGGPILQMHIHRALAGSGTSFMEPSSVVVPGEEPVCTPEDPIEGPAPIVVEVPYTPTPIEEEPKEPEGPKPRPRRHRTDEYRVPTPAGWKESELSEQIPSTFNIVIVAGSVIRTFPMQGRVRY